MTNSSGAHVSATTAAQNARNEALLRASHYMRGRVESDVLAFALDIDAYPSLTPADVHVLNGLSTEAARIALRSLASLAKINELDHLGGGLELIPALLMTLAVTDYRRIHYTIEHAHTSIGYYSSLSAMGFLEEKVVVDEFRRGIDMAGHVAWVPGGTELNGGRLGVMIPAAVGQSLGLRARVGADGWTICHCGDAGWISGQALNGFNAADLHHAPITFIMHRNGIQLSGRVKNIMAKDPRTVIKSMGIEVLEVPTLHEAGPLYKAYRHARGLAREGRPSLIYPVGYRSGAAQRVDLTFFGEKYGILPEVTAFASKHKVAMSTEIWIPGSLMSWRDLGPMIECLFFVNNLPGGEAHHDGHMKGRSLDEALAGPMFRDSAEQKSALGAMRSKPRRKVVTTARPAVGSPNLLLPDDVVAAIELPAAGKSASPRAGTEPAYAAIAKKFPESVFVVSCDLDPSTKLAKAAGFLAPNHKFEMSIEEQASAIMANGLAVSSRDPQLTVFSTFCAFFEGIAREGFDMWRYQRNLTGANEGLNVTFHLSHVGANTGRDHFSGWCLDWITLGLSYLPFLHRFYTPGDARVAFQAVRDLAAHYGGHIIGIPRDNLPVLAKQGSTEPLWDHRKPWEPVTAYRSFPGARRAILACGAPAWLAGEAAEKLSANGTPVDALIVNGFPLPERAIESWLKQYPEGLVTVEDSLIGTPTEGIRGFAGLVRTAAYGSGVPLAHIGIVNPRVAPSEGFLETWAHFGITRDAIVEAVRGL